MSAAIEAFHEAITAAGLTPPDTIHDDGVIHRFSTNGRRSDDSGYYVLHRRHPGGFIRMLAGGPAIDMVQQVRQHHDDG
jgi:hypothetical protein